MKQKLALCCALIHKPAILFLDEPTTGVDPVSRREFWEMLKRLQAQEITIMVSTPYMDEATLCDRIALMQEGKIFSVNTPEKIIHSYPDELFEVKANNMHALLKLIPQYPETLSGYAFGEFAHIAFKNQHAGEPDFKEFLSSKGLTDIEIRRTTVTIEDCFIKRLKN